LIAAAALAWIFAGASSAWGVDRGAAGTYVSIPDSIASESGSVLAVERGLFFVPENRSRPASRVIAVQFLRFESLDPAVAAGQTKRPPVFLLAGGPGSEFDFSKPSIFRKVQRLRQTRDVVYVSQRGNPRAAGLVPPLWLPTLAIPLDEPGSAARTRERDRAALTQSLAEWTAKGLDLFGYDILNIVDDLHDLRAALGYDKIVLCACSFGSQWSFAYIKRWPETVDRALLSGVEPLDYAYDSPKWLWASMTRLARSAEADPKLAPRIPHGGLMKVIRTLTTQLEAHPVKASITDPATGKSVEIALGAEDLRAAIADTSTFDGATKRDRLTHWPRFLIELSESDYRYLAAKTWEKRTQPPREVLILPLIDNSLGITPARDAKIVAEREARWLGDINAYYHNTRVIWSPHPTSATGFAPTGTSRFRCCC